METMEHDVMGYDDRLCRFPDQMTVTVKKINKEKNKEKKHHHDVITVKTIVNHYDF